MMRFAPGSLHYGRTEDDYKHLIALREKYKLKLPPIEELKKACLADGYPQSKVDSLKYPDTSNDDVDEIIGRKVAVVQELEHENFDADSDEEVVIDPEDEVILEDELGFGSDDD